MRKFLSIAIIVCSPLLLNISTGGAASVAHAHWYDAAAKLPNQTTVQCILHAESRSTYEHPNLGDTDPESFGPWQFTTILWNYWSWQAGVGRKAAGWFRGTIALHAVTVAAYQATLVQQTKVFAYVARHDGLWPWVGGDGHGGGDGCA
jgi:hypothetical protein